MKGSAVKIDSIQKHFGDFHVLKGVSLEIKKGEFFSLLGPSGCGKTTLLRMIAGFDTPDTGDILLDDRSVLELPPNQRHVNTVFQNYALFPHLNVFENIAFPLRLQKRSEIEINERVLKYTELVKLSEHVHKSILQLSGGQRQRVAIARALINEPAVLLLDEPLSALDAKLRQQLLIELDAIHDQVGITFIYVTHDQQEALGVSDRIAVMHKGEVLQVGSSSEIYENPANEFVATFIGETNTLHGTVTSIDETAATITTNELGILRIALDPRISIGKSIALSLRPEKIKISRGKPRDLNHISALHEGIIDELIYGGYQSRIFVKTNHDHLCRVCQAHMPETKKESLFKWKEKVSIWWSIDDCTITEVK